MDLIIINGASASGKMTVGQALAKALGYNLMYNHLTIEPVLELFGEYDTTIINRLRSVLLEELVRKGSDGIIFTCCLDLDEICEKFWLLEQIDLIKEQLLIYRDNEPLNVYFVTLLADLDTRLERNTTQNRLDYKRSKRDLQLSEQLLLKDKDIRCVLQDEERRFYKVIKDITIVNDNLSIDEQVNLIKSLLLESQSE